MSHRGRVAKLERDAANDIGLRAHWHRVFSDRLTALAAFLKAVPRSHGAQVVEAIGEADELVDDLLTNGGQFRRPETSIMQWLSRWCTWGQVHPKRKAMCPEPIPAALLDLFLAHPQVPPAGLGECPGCGVALPQGPPAKGSAYDAIWPKQTGGDIYPVCEFCPCCKANIPDAVFARRHWGLSRATCERMRTARLNGGTYEELRDIETGSA
ncbi:MAG TPA: hypothetical protein VN641_06515 [Urbifossiella sp.]|nr:hypothetical protein [Urbifossiella sp.]